MHARNISDTQFRSRQANRNIAARRARFVARIEAMPDALERWEFLFAVLEQQLDLNRRLPPRLRLRLIPRRR